MTPVVPMSAPFGVVVRSDPAKKLSCPVMILPVDPHR
jgi:hypothetical protein